MYMKKLLGAVCFVWIDCLPLPTKTFCINPDVILHAYSQLFYKVGWSFPAPYISDQFYFNIQQHLSKPSWSPPPIRHHQRPSACKTALLLQLCLVT